MRQEELKKVDEKAGAEKQPGAKMQAEKEIGRERVDPWVYDYKNIPCSKKQEVKAQCRMQEQ